MHRHRFVFDITASEVRSVRLNVLMCSPVLRVKKRKVGFRKEEEGPESSYEELCSSYGSMYLIEKGNL